ncbi:MAG: ribosome biogenesis GTPase Der [Anaerolineae bacterium]|nr:ribosome biogenesis GTPase Der [Anaerolineae bacterium]
MGMKNIPLVALVGRPNVGKSTLFNRIVGRRLAVIHDRPGTTRDRQQAEADWRGVAFTLVDTGGIEALNRVLVGAADPVAEDSAQFIAEIRAQAELAIADADVIVMVVDLISGVTAADEEVADILRRANKPVLVAASKGDNQERRDGAVEFYNLGLSEIYPVSGMHGTGVGDLLDAVVEALPQKPPESEEDDDSLKIAIVGRPNVGKSSLLNRLLGKERVIVSPVPGTTRDAIDTQVVWHDQLITLIDTAGIRRRGKIDHGGVEQYSVLRALKALKRADVALLLIDAIEGITSQDAHIASFVLEEKLSVIVLVNKWDAVEKDSYTMLQEEEKVRDALKFLPYVPIIFISAKTGQRVSEIIPLALQVHEERFVRIPTADINRILRAAVARQAPPFKAGKRLKLRYGSQVAVDPPKFLFHVNDVDLVHFTYARYLENQIRAVYPFTGTPILMSFRAGKEDRRGR